MKSNTTYRTKLRAVFLAAIMVTSVVGVSVAFAGASTAVVPTELDANDLDGTLVYQGQEFNVTGLNDVDFNAGDDAYLARADNLEDNEFSVIDPYEIEAGTGGNFIDSIETDDLEPGESYVIVNQTSQNSAAVYAGNFSLTEQRFDVEWDEDSVTEDDNDVEIELDTQRTGDYNVTVSADGMSYDELEALFTGFTDGADAIEPAGDALNIGDDADHIPVDRLGFDRDDDDFDDIKDDGFLTLNLSSSSSWNADDVLIANFTNLDNVEGLPDDGEYEFEFIVTDTTATASDSIAISEDGQDGEFSQGVYQGTAGDIVEFTIELEDTDEAWIQIGDEDAGFLDVIYVKDDDDSGEVTFKMNTRLAGTNVSTDDVYYSDDDDIVASAVHDYDDAAAFDNLEAGFFDEDTDDPFDGDGTTQDSFVDYLEELDLIDDDSSDGGHPLDQLTRPLQPTDYELTASADGKFIADDGVSEADDELDSALLELQVPGIGDIITHVAPEDNADEDDELADLLEAVTQRDEIALDDRLIVQVEATGLYGAMLNKSSEQWDLFEDGTNAQTLEQLVDESGEGIDFTLEAEETTGNQDPTELDLSNTDKEEILILVDPDGGQFFIIVDTSEDDAWSSGTPSDGDTFTATLEYETDDDNRYEFENDQSDAGMGPFVGGANGVPADDAYPYFSPGNDESATASFDFEEREINFNNLNADDEIQAENVEDSTISGVTNIAPGTSGEIRVASTDASDSFRLGQSIDINEDGEVAAEFDFSGQEVGDEFDTRFRASGSTIDTVDSVIVEEGDLGVDEPVEDDEDDVVDDEDDVVDDEDDVVDDEDDAVDDGDDEEPVDDETPGFGALVALVALIGAALLAVRRQN